MESLILTYFVKTNILFIPLLLAGICHLFVIHYNLFPYLTKPIYPKAFGKNKTYRGFIIIGFLTSLGVFIVSKGETYLPEQFKIGFPENVLSIGLLVGLAAMFFELPNSFLKRKLGINPGGPPTKYKAFFYLFNQADSVIGCTLIYALFFDIDWNILLSFFIYTSIMHLIINMLFSFLKLRKNPF